MDIGVGGVELLFGFFGRDQRTAEPGADGIDEDEVGEVEPGAGIIEQAGGIRRAVAFVAELDVLGTDCAQVEIDGRSARAAVEGKSYGAVLALHGVGGEDYVARFFAFVIDGKGSDGRLILEGFAVQLDALRGVRVGGQGRLFFGGLIVFFRRVFGGGGSRCGFGFLRGGRRNEKRC